MNKCGALYVYKFALRSLLYDYRRYEFNEHYLSVQLEHLARVYPMERAFYMYISKLSQRHLVMNGVSAQPLIYGTNLKWLSRKCKSTCMMCCI